MTLQNAQRIIELVGTKADCTAFTAAPTEIIYARATDTSELGLYDGSWHWYLTGGAGSDTTAIHNNVANEISGITEKTTLTGNDLFIIEDSAAAGVKKKVKQSNLGLAGGGVTRSGSTTDLHLAIWNGSDADSIKDGGVVPSAGVTRSGATTDAHLAVWNGSSADSIKDGGAVPTASPADGWTSDANTWSYSSADADFNRRCIE